MKKEMLDLINKKVNEQITEFKKVGIYSMGKTESIIKGKKEKGEQLIIIVFRKDGRTFQSQLYVNENALTSITNDGFISIIVDQIKRTKEIK